MPMETHDLQTRSFYVGDWLVEPSFNRLSNEAGSTLLQPKMMEVLVYLAEHAGTTVSHDELIAVVWQDFDVLDNVLYRTISNLRKALRSGTPGVSFIKTVPKKGYCLIAPVRLDATDHYGTAAWSSGDGFAKTDTPVAAPPVSTPPSTPLRQAKNPLPWLFSIAAVVIALVLAFRFIPLSDPVAPSAMPRLFTSMNGSEIHPAFSPDGKHLAYVWTHADHGADIYVQPVDGEVPRQLTTDPRFEYRPAWSPDGQHIAYYSFDPDNLSDCGIYVRPVDGGPARKMIDCDKARQRKLAWSPDGKWLAFEVLDVPADTWRLHLLSLETLAHHPATVPGATDALDQNFAFSPDSRRLLFFRLDPTSTESRGDFFFTSIADTPTTPERLTHGIGWVLDFGWAYERDELVFFSLRDQKRGLWRMEINADTPELLITIPEIIGGVSVSPQGDHVAYVSWNYQENLWRIPLPDEETPDPQCRVLIHSTRRDVAPQISPSGRRLAFASNRTGFYELWVSDDDGRNQIKLTAMNTGVQSPRWSPDERFIAVHADQGGQRDIYIIDTEGGPPRRLTHNRADDVLPNWSRDGRTIYFSSARSGVYELWKIPVEGGEAVQVTHDGGFTSFEAWDGQSLFFSKNAQPGLWQLDYDSGAITRLTDALAIPDYNSWTVTQDALYYLKREEHAPTMLVRYDLAVGEATPVMPVPRNLSYGGRGLGLTVSPDEQWLVYGRVDERSSDLMMVETQ